jgi:predicted ester cyclase
MAEPLTLDRARQIIQPLYDVMTLPLIKNVEDAICAITSPEWCSFKDESTSKDRDTFIREVKHFGAAIPDLVWDVQEVLPSGSDKIIVRSQASGTPVMEVFGVPPAGKTFNVMTIDIHTLGSDGKLIQTYHVEDWFSAVRQLQE